MKTIYLNGWELNYLQSTLNRWYDYKGIGTFSDEEQDIISSIKSKVNTVQTTSRRTSKPMANSVPVSLSPAEDNFLQSLLYVGKQDYGRGAGNSVFETGVRLQVQQRSVEINSSILAKLQGNKPPIVDIIEQSEPLEDG